VKRWIVRLFTALLTAVVVVAALMWLTVRASLPQLDGQIAAADLTAPVSIVRDAAGIPTITGSDRLDLSFALGFVHGQDRFFQMDLIRRDAAGELSEIVGPATINADQRRRVHRFRSRVAIGLASLSAPEQEILRRYSEGVNAGLDSLDAKPFEYYLLGVEPEPWLPEDALLVAQAMFLDLNYGLASHDRQRGLMARILPAEVLAWMDPTGSPWDAPMLGDAWAAAAIPDAAVLSLRDATVAKRPFSEVGAPPILGSNNWVVSGDLTASGRALVSNDMHLGINVPNIWYRVRLVSTGPRTMDVSGVSLPGQPMIIAGSNSHIAWGLTNSNGDWSDAILLKPGSEPDSYQTPEGDKPFDVYKERILVKDADSVEFIVRETIWGPVDDRAAYPDGEIAVSWIAHHSHISNLDIMQLENATTVDEALNIGNTIVMPPQNFVVGDEDGNIGWTIAGKIPLRGDYDATLPADWSKEQGWQGWLPPEQYPRIVNPESGRIWSANTRVVDGEALRLIGDGGYAFGARAKQIRDGLFAKESFEPQDMLAIQIDDRALFLDSWRSLLLDVLSDTTEPELQEYRRLVENWIPRATAESVGYRLLRAFRNEVRRRVFDVLMTPLREAYGDDVNIRISRQFEAPLWSVVTQQPQHLLPSAYANWNDFMLDAVRAVVRGYDENFAGTLSDRTWGEFNTASIRHPLSPVLPALSEWLDMPAEPLDGDTNMPRVQGPRTGASERFSVMPGDEASGLMHMPDGQSGHPMSDFYRSGHAAWVNGEQTPFLPGAAQYELILQPATR
jgi:penicillin amidase